MARSPDVRDTLPDSLRGLVQALLGRVRVRIELLAAEAGQARHQLVMLLACTLAAILLLFLALVLGSFLVVFAFWDTPDRLLAAGLVTTVPAIAGAAFALAVVRQVRETPRLFDGTRTALDADLAALVDNVPRVDARSASTRNLSLAAVAAVAGAALLLRPGVAAKVAALSRAASVAARLWVVARVGWQFARPWLTRPPADPATQRSIP